MKVSFEETLAFEECKQLVALGRSDKHLYTFGVSVFGIVAKRLDAFSFKETLSTLCYIASDYCKQI